MVLTCRDILALNYTTRGGPWLDWWETREGAKAYRESICSIRDQETGLKLYRVSLLRETNCRRDKRPTGDQPCQQRRHRRRHLKEYDQHEVRQ